MQGKAKPALKRVSWWCQSQGATRHGTTQANAQSAQPQIEPSTIESDLLKTNENIATQSREILQTFVWREASSCPHPTKTYKRL